MLDGIRLLASSSVILVDGAGFIVGILVSQNVDFIYDVTYISGADVGSIFYVNDVLFTTKKLYWIC